MLAISLQSGSNGNCIYVEGGGARVLVDAGISGIQVERRLALRGRDISRVDAVLISHDHSDHVRCAGVLGRKYGLPIYATRDTLRAAESSNALGHIPRVCHFASGDTLRFGSMTVQTIPTPHDAADGVAFVFSDGEKSLGVLTDLGHVFDGLDRVIRSLNAVFIESNYDPEMLRKGPYPRHLQERIRGPRGHISNAESARLLRDHAHPGLRWACLSHLSEQNNRPELALHAHRTVASGGYELIAASRYEPGVVLEV